MLYSRHLSWEYGDNRCITVLALCLKRCGAEGKLHFTCRDWLEIWKITRIQVRQVFYPPVQGISLRFNAILWMNGCWEKTSRLPTLLWIPSWDSILTQTPAQINCISSLGIFYSSVQKHCFSVFLSKWVFCLADRTPEYTFKQEPCVYTSYWIAFFSWFHLFLFISHLWTDYESLNGTFYIKVL